MTCSCFQFKANMRTQPRHSPCTYLKPTSECRQDISLLPFRSQCAPAPTLSTHLAKILASQELLFLLLYFHGAQEHLPLWPTEPENQGMLPALSFSVYSNWSCYQLRIDYYIHRNLMVTAKQKFIINTQRKKRKKFKHKVIKPQGKERNTEEL